MTHNRDHIVINKIKASVASVARIAQAKVSVGWLLVAFVAGLLV